MAVWQYDFKLISENNFKDINLNTIVWELCDAFWLIIEKSTNKIVIGNYESNNCILYFDWWKIQEISCRLDMRSISQPTIQKLKWIVEGNNLKFAIMEEKILEGEEFIKRLISSPALKFVHHPEEFFQEL
jgi:hypothetical protein